MFTVICNYLSVPEVEVDIERLFNIARDILGLYRALMGGETIRALILVKDYLRYKELGLI
jgi:hypothetical protein